MKRFVTLAHGCFVSCTFMADGYTNGPVVWINGWSDGMVMPGLMKGAKHKVSKVSVCKTSRDEFKWKRLEWWVMLVSVHCDGRSVSDEGFSFRVILIQVGWDGSDGSKSLMLRKFITKKRPGKGRIIRELDGSCLVLDKDGEVLSAGNGSQGEKAVAESFNKVNVGEAKDGFLTIVGCEVAFGGSFMGGCFGASVSKGDRNAAGYNVAKVIEDWSIVAGSSTIRKPVAEMRWSKTLMRRTRIVRIDFDCVGIGWLMLSRRWEISVKERLVDFHLRELNIRPDNGLWSIVVW